MLWKPNMRKDKQKTRYFQKYRQEKQVTGILIDRTVKNQN